MKQRLTYVDMLNVAACAGVLLLHSTNGPVHHFDGNVDAGWFTGLFTHSFFLWPVDVFFMLSGVTMMGTCQELTGGVKSGSSISGGCDGWASPCWRGACSTRP